VSETVRSMVFGPSVLYGVAIVALVLTFTRKPTRFSAEEIDPVLRLYLIGIAF
jgi:hypothetical protein